MPAATIQKLGLNWSTTQKTWLDSKCNNTTPCDPKIPGTNQNLAKAICEGTFTATGSVPATPAATTEYTVYVNDKATKMTQDQIVKGLADGTIDSKTTRIWDQSKGQTQDAIIPISTFTTDKTIADAIKNIAPTIQTEISYNVFLDNKVQGPLKGPEIEAQIKAGKITTQTQVANLSTQNQWVAAGERPDLKPFFDALGPQAPVQQNTCETKFPNIKSITDQALKDRVCKWGDSPQGAYVLSLKDNTQKEDALDNLDRRRGDAETKALKKEIRQALGMKADTWGGRVKSAFTGAVQGAQTGFNTQTTGTNQTP